MPTWPEVKATVLKSFPSSSKELDEGMISLVVPTYEKRVQQVFIGDLGKKIMIWSVIAEISEVDLRALFKLEFFQNVPFGASAMGESLVLKHALLLETLDMVELSTPVDEMAKYADYLEGIVRDDKDDY